MAISVGISVISVIPVTRLGGVVIFFFFSIRNGGHLVHWSVAVLAILEESHLHCSNILVQLAIFLQSLIESSQNV